MFSGYKNNQVPNMINDEICEDYLFQYSETGDQVYNNESCSENRLEKYEQFNDYNNDSNILMFQDDNLNTNKDFNYEVQKDYNDYYTQQLQNQPLYNPAEQYQYNEAYEENNYVNYQNFQNQNYAPKNISQQQHNNSYSNKKYSQNQQQQQQQNDRFTMALKYNQKPYQVAYFNQGYQEEPTMINNQIKIDQNRIQSNQDQKIIYSSNNIRNIQDNYKEKEIQQNLIPKEEVQQQDSEANLSNFYNYNQQQQQPLFKAEQAFEQVIQQSSSIPASVNYYQIYQDYYNKQNLQSSQGAEQNIQSKINNPQVKSEEDEILSQVSTLPNSSNNKEQYQENEQEEENGEKNMQNESDSFYSSPDLEAKKILIRNSNKKNVVKNIMSAFKNFILEPLHHNYNLKDLDVVLEMYNQTKKGIDDMSEMQAKFKRYITSKNFNHYTVKLLIQHQNYSNVFKYFLSGPIEEWITASKVADVNSHKIMIEFLKECFDDIRLIDLLKRHEKKRAHFQ
ncbi:hypothetical protein TTHERM_00448630 (macronuclear) [Tetrahymena thermophila SB210]|uniref:Uncharacterized protein n=1 Tax=Tetrahymena thermophila (strain SB210) TaxID=312017 RepID=Q239F1_TETTS|nr:hypothetical protein TTHERM_00448630 [Tetrahymena thermophila SB210]EAR93019.1 hypothetical protein TTHERM_00448630 [Tetrahymena thermophila SB210]|eukprot:XP_001013264.1 hypothetical protein TTHERM_00448630 [Tetrahymena thermophila SB210]